MFGIYRTSLAIVVVIHHLGYIPIIGHFAVHGFFILSGFLMTTIMHERYHFNLKGIKKFYLNRALRLYPQNFAMLMLSFLIISYYGEDISSVYRSHLFLPSTVAEWTQNISLIYVDFYPSNISPRLLPPTWALTVELFFYALIGLGLSKNKSVTVMWFSLSVSYFIISHLYDLPYRDRYSSVIAGSLGFSIGAIMYHYKNRLLKYFKCTSIYLPVGLFFVTFLNMLCGALCHYFDFDNAFYFFFYSNYFLNTVTILSLLQAKAPSKIKSLDSTIGDYSYPLYLVHWPLGLIVSMVLFGKPINEFSLASVIVAFLGLTTTCFLSCFSIRFIDKPIEKLRKKLK